MADKKIVIKRFAKGLIAALVAAAFTYFVSFFEKNPMVLGTMTPLLTGLLLAAEKAFLSL